MPSREPPHPAPRLGAPAATQSPFFSVITATYEAAALLPRTRASLRAQRCRDFEWIVVDGGSRDSTRALVASFGAEVSMFVSEPDQGIADAWNKGLRLATGRYVLFLNAGDEYADVALLRLRAAALEHPGRVVCSHAWVCGEDGAPLHVFHARPRQLWRGMHAPHGWCAVPREEYEAFGGYRLLRHAMDFDWFHRFYLARGAAAFAVVDEPLGHFHLGGVSDAGFRESFRANEAILVESGTPRLLARCLRVLYVARHARLRKRTAGPSQEAP